MVLPFFSAGYAISFTCRLSITFVTDRVLVCPIVWAISFHGFHFWVCTRSWWAFLEIGPMPSLCFAYVGEFSLLPLLQTFVCRLRYLALCHKRLWYLLLHQGILLVPMWSQTIRDTLCRILSSTTFCRLCWSHDQGSCFIIPYSRCLEKTGLEIT